MKHLRTAAPLLAATLLLAVTAACSDSETEWVNAPTVSVSQAAITAGDEGGTYTAAISVANQTDDGTISAAPAVSWITVTSCTTSAVTFSVAENNNSDPRTGRVTVTYSYSLAGKKGTATCEFTVAQSCGDQPMLSVQPTAVVAAIEGGSYSFTYTVVNPTSDGELTCSTSASWITNITPSNGTVSFQVAENTDTARREGVITVEYLWAGGSISDSVTVVQDYEDGSSDGGEFDGSIDSLVGTYTASGYAYYASATAAYTTWTLTIYKSSSTEVIIDGLVPKVEGYYPSSSAYVAKASLNAAGQLVIPSQFTGFTSSNGEFIGWTPCVDYQTGEGWYYSPDMGSTACTLTYNSSTGVWTSDYGMFLGLFTTYDFATAEFDGFFDVTNPGFQITKGNGGSGGGGGGGSGDLSEFVGTYTCTGTTTSEDGGQISNNSWTMKMYDVNGSLLISGLVPDTIDYYPYTDSNGVTHTDTGPYVAFGRVSGNNIYVSVPQFTGWQTTYNGKTEYICWVASPGYENGKWYYSQDSGDIIFEYNSSTGTWTSDYGMMLALSTSNSSLVLDVFYDAFNPGMAFTKTSGSTSTGAAPLSLKGLEERSIHTDVKAAPVSASGSNLKVQKTGKYTVGDAVHMTNF